MPDLNSRGRLEVSQDSWMWRWYWAWKIRKGDDRAYIDLCHFMRVLLIFGPWRWYWGLDHKVPPFIVTGIGMVVALITYLVVHWPDAAVTALVWTLAILLLGVALASVVGLLIYGFIRWRNVNPDRVDDLLRNIFMWGTIWIWGPIILAAYAAEWLWNRILERPFRRVFMKPLFYIGYREYLVGIWIYLFMLFAVYGVVLATWPQWVLGFTAGFIGGLVVLFALVAALVLSYRKIQRWLAERPAPPPRLVEDRPAKPTKEHWRGARLFWSWLVAKKHRICPLIEPIGETHE